MKTLSKFTVLCGCLGIFSAAFILSCSKSDDVAGTRLKLTSKWKHQVDHAISISELESNNGNRLSLVDYKYLGVIKDAAMLDAIMDDIFADNAHIILNDIKGKSFGAAMWGDKQLFSDDYKNDLALTIKDHIQIGKTGLLELTWSYNGQPIKSTALVDNDEGIVYDNIASYAVNYKATKEVVQSRKVFKRPFTRAETEHVNAVFADSVAADTSIREFVQQDQSQDIELISGKKAWWYYIHVTSAFNRYGRLAYRKCDSDSDASWGWQCKADAKTLSGEVNVSDFHEFAWAWAYGTGKTTIQIGFAGNGFTITGGEYEGKRSDIHRP